MLYTGTGACAIYPLLAAVKQKWFMIGTEMDAVSLEKAQENVKRNNLQELVESMFIVLIDHKLEYAVE